MTSDDNFIFCHYFKISSLDSAGLAIMHQKCIKGTSDVIVWNYIHTMFQESLEVKRFYGHILLIHNIWIFSTIL